MESIMPTTKKKRTTKKKAATKTGTPDRIEFVAPTTPNDHLIRDAIKVFNLSGSDDGPQILGLLQQHRQNIDTIIDDDQRVALCVEKGWEEPTEAERVAIIHDFIKSSGEKSESEWISCLSADRKRVVNLPKYFKLRAQRLREQIRQIRRKMREAEKKMAREMDAHQSQIEGNPLSVSWATALDDEAQVPIERVPTGDPLLDEWFGFELGENGEKIGGMTQGHTYLVGAERGMGKTRWLVEMCGRLCGPCQIDYMGREFGGLRGLYIQGEETPQRFAKMFASKVWRPDVHDVHLSDTAVFMAQHESLIRQLRPQLVIIDSKDMMKDWRHPRDAENAVKLYNHWAEKYGFILFVISHVNAKGEIKGGTNLPHMVRAVIKGYKDQHDPHSFHLLMDKNRGSQANGTIRWRHEEDTVHLVDPKKGHTVVKTELSPDMAVLSETVIEATAKPVASTLLDAVEAAERGEGLPAAQRIEPESFDDDSEG